MLALPRRGGPRSNAKAPSMAGIERARPASATVTNSFDRKMSRDAARAGFSRVPMGLPPKRRAHLDLRRAEIEGAGPESCPQPAYVSYCLGAMISTIEVWA